LPPLGGELGERLLAGVELREVVGALERSHLGLEGVGVGRAVERAAPLATDRVVPAHAPDGVGASVSALAFSLLDHRLLAVRGTLNLPPAGASRGGAGTRPLSGTTTASTWLSVSQASTSAGRIREAARAPKRLAGRRPERGRVLSR